MRNTLFVVAAQVVVTPLTIVLNGIIARKLGPAEYGQLYLATTLAALAFLFVEWGHSGALTGGIARDRTRAGLLLGSSLAWRASTALIAALILVIACSALGYDRAFLSIVALALLTALFGTFSYACHDVFRGFERTDFGAITYVAWQFLSAAVVIPTLLLGGGIHALLLAQAACAVLGGLFMWFVLKPMGVPALKINMTAVRELMHAGTPFLIFALVIALQTNIDALMLSKLGSAESMGWYAASRKLIGLLIYPANALVTALYPTLCRLYVHDRTAFRVTSASALHLTAIAVTPIALGCGLFPDLGIRIFSIESFGKAAINLQIMAGYILMVYFSMPLGSTLTAAGKQRAWAAAQLLCVALNAALNSLLIPWFQVHYQNGSLGVCVSTVFSEALMLGTGLWLLPKQILDRALIKKLVAAAFGGALMALTAWSMTSFSSFVVAPIAIVAYILGIWLAGGIDVTTLQEGRRLLRGNPTTPSINNAA
jgi:O-antigen/teichoic acid export membrane protein